MTHSTYALALAAGMLATVNPCGFALLPTYVSLLVLPGPDDTAGRDSSAAGRPGGAEGSRGRAIGRALLMTGAMTGGFVAVFAVFGLVVTPLALSVQRYLPWVTLVVGTVLMGVGLWLVSGREIYLATPRLRAGRPTRAPVSLAAYGASYAVASLSCTIGPFLALTTSALRSASLAAGIAVFGAYAAGMGLVVGVLTLGTALAWHTLAGRLRRVLPYVSRAGGLLLVVAGGYVTYYGWYELRVFAGASAQDPVVAAAVRVQSQLARWLDTVGPRPVAATFLVLALLVALATRRRHPSGTASGPRGDGSAERASDVAHRLD
jgi:cytochrome c biogenesis protein CcdA